MHGSHAVLSINQFLSLMIIVTYIQLKSASVTPAAKYYLNRPAFQTWPALYKPAFNMVRSNLYGAIFLFVCHLQESKNKIMIDPSSNTYVEEISEDMEAESVAIVKIKILPQIVAEECKTVPEESTTVAGTHAAS